MSGWDWFEGVAAADETDEADRVHWQQCFGTACNGQRRWGWFGQGMR